MQKLVVICLYIFFTVMKIAYRKWLLDYKLLHVFLWALVWASSIIGFYDSREPLIPQMCNAAMVIVVSFIPFYATAYYIIPVYLYKKRYAAFITLLVLENVIIGLLMMVAVRFVDHVFDPSKPIIPQTPEKLRSAIDIFIWTTLIASFGAGGLKIMSDSFRLRRRLLEVEKEKIATELNFLRSQINPHFLFNVINTIYFQIDKKNEKARESVEKLSEMLRYQLYECTTDKIDIDKEVDYIKNYIDVQTLRMEKGSDIKLTVEGNMCGFKIAPLLILPIVENAFKHVSAFKDAEQNKIYISLSQNGEQTIIINACNTYQAGTGEKHLIQTGGLGVQNLKRRLELLYPNRHVLNITPGENMFETTLKLQYDD